MNKNETLEQFKWVDTHCHLQLTKDKIEDLYLDNIEYLIIPGVDIKSSLEARDVSLSLDKESYWSAGLHPHEADQFENLKETFDNLFNEADLIGETGLDYYRNLSSKTNQINSLKYHLDIQINFLSQLFFTAEIVFQICLMSSLKVIIQILSFSIRGQVVIGGLKNL